MTSRVREQLMKIWKIKFTIIKKLKCKKDKKKEVDKIYLLKQNLDDFKINKVFISAFLKGLWNCPEAMYHIFINTDPSIVKSKLAPFVIDNFYNSNLSGNYIENSLLYIIALMLEEEICKITDIKDVDKFLEDTRCGYLLEELIKVPDIQIFFKKIIINTIEKMETTCSFRKLNFSVEKIKEIIKLTESGKGKKNKKEKTNEQTLIENLLDQSKNYLREENNKKLKERNELFTSKYIPDITSEELKKLSEKAKNEKKPDLSSFYNKLSNEIELYNNHKLFCNQELMNKMVSSAYPTFLLSIYQNDFLEIISFIQQLMADIMDNIILLPNSVQYICKIISILIRRKFKKITLDEENAFISKFVIEKLLIQMISKPSFNGLINEFIVSGNTIENINTMNIILRKLFAGKLFLNDQNEGDFTPFNWLIFEQIEKVFAFFRHVKNINLPEFLDKCAKGELPEEYTYNYFKENKGEIYANISICFNVDILIILIKGLTKGNFFINMNPTITKLKLALERFTERALNDIQNINAQIVKSQIEVIQKKKNSEKDYGPFELEIFFIYNNDEIEKSKEDIFSVENKVGNFYINIKKIEKNKKLSEKEKNLIKIKNYLSNSLGNYRLLNKSDFTIGATSDTKKMLNEIKYYMTLPNFIINNDTIPSKWYINCILDYLDKIPEEYKKNDYNKLFLELNKNLKDSINNLNFESLILFRNKFKFIDKMNNYYEKVDEVVHDIYIKEKVKDIVENLYLPVEVNFKYSSTEKKFELKKISIKAEKFEDKIIFEDNKRKVTNYKTIEAFSTYFPNLVKYQLLQGINPLDIISELKINDKINIYFQIIRDKAIEKEIKQNEYETLYKEKIEDYVMNKLYEKIYPPEPDEKDSQVFKKCMHHSWIEPHHIEAKDYIYDNILPDILNEFQLMNISKTPLKKYKCLKKIIYYIRNLILFNEGEEKEIAQDDIIPVLNYVFIKAKPFRIFTDIELIKLFLKNENESDQDIQSISSLIDIIIKEYNAKYFKMSQEEYEQKCFDAITENQKSNV